MRRAYALENSDKIIQQILGSARQVHAVLGPGFLEGIYVRALVSELKHKRVYVEREKLIKIWYGAHVIGKHRLDLLIESAVIVELKANSGIVAVHVAQMRSYLQAASYPAGLILNFGRPELEWEVLFANKPVKVDISAD